MSLGVGAFVGGLVVALLAVHFFGSAPSASASASVERALGATSLAAGDRHGTPVPRSIGSPASASADGSGPVDADICGMPGLTLNPTLALEDDPRFAARVDATNKRFLDVLSTDADERVRAAGLLLRRQEDLRLAYRAEAVAVDSLCGADAGCIKAAEKQWPSADTLQSILPATDALARMAATSSSPAVYAAAIDACQGFRLSVVPTAPACQLVSVDQWARIDPDNADAWLHVAGEAVEHRDAAALDDAMNRVAHAGSSRIYGNTLAALVDAAVPAGGDDFDATQMHMAAWKLVSSWSFPPLQTVTRYCAQPLLADSNRRQTCDAVAHEFVDNGSTLIERAIGINLGSRLGWPAETVAAARQEQAAIQRAQSLSLNDYNDITSCGAVAKRQKLMRQMGQLGEVGAARAALAASGRSVADLAAEVEVERAAATANPPANAASPASAAATP